MIQIRNSMFETNSSSCHTLIIQRFTEDTLNKTVDLSEDSFNGDFIRRIVREMNDDNIEKLINWLYLHGVENIMYNGSRQKVYECIEKYKDHPIDLGMPEPDNAVEDGDWTDQLWINLLNGNFEEFYGSDCHDVDDDELDFWLD